MRSVCGSALVCLALLLPSTAHAVAPRAPAWSVVQSTLPTNLVAGTQASPLRPDPELSVLVTNVGGASASSARVTVRLPDGLSSSPEEGPFYGYSPGNAGATRQSCSTSGQTVTCEVSGDLSVVNSEPPRHIGILPASIIWVRIPLSVSADATSGSAAEVSVEGGGSAARSIFGVSVGTAPPSFSLSPQIFGVDVNGVGGEVPLAGSHPFNTKIEIGVPTTEFQEGPNKSHAYPLQDLRNLRLSMPEGLVLDPQGTSVRCSAQVASTGSIADPNVLCPQASQVGRAYFSVSGEYGSEAVYNTVPPPGAAAAVSFQVESVRVVILGGISEGYQITADVSDLQQHFRVPQISVDLWGVPSDPAHDFGRKGGILGNSLDECDALTEGCSIAPSPAPFVTMPTSCSETPSISGIAQSWQGSVAEATRLLADASGSPLFVRGCGELTFEPAISSGPTTTAGDSPAGLDFNLHQTQDESLEGRATAAMKDATVTLPEGMTLNPSAAGGLGSCSEEQIGYHPEEGKIRFATTPQSCPDSAKVGTLEVKTPLLAKKLGGSIFVARPYANPFGSLLAVYLAVEDEETGIIAKLTGKVEPNPVTGQLTARFTENPELPIEDIELHFFPGPRAALKTPLTCGAATTTSTLTPWSTPEGADAHPSDSFQVSGACSASETAAPKSAMFTAGTASPVAGAYSPFVLRVSRPDGSQRINSIETTLPGGLLGRLAGVSYCPESGIAQAKSREAPEKGKLELASPSCPQSSEVGTVRVAAGAGASPIEVTGHAYLAGPYKGAPLSLVTIVPAVTGPFDLGDVVTRVALNVGEYDARIRAVSDPLPTIIDGIPLDVRSLEIDLDRPDFTLNPTSCREAVVSGQIGTPSGGPFAVANRFQVGDCARLAFKPKLKLSLKGSTKRTGHPGLKAVLTYPKKGAFANVARAQVSLPHSEFLDQANIAKSCTKPVLAAGGCPASTVYGRARAWSPLLDKPLEGPVYLVGGYGYKLPALVAELDGQIRVLLVGKIDTDRHKGIRATFEAVPDAPVERFVIELKGGGKYGLLENSEDVCLKKAKAGVALRAQNGRKKKLSVNIARNCDNETSQTAR